jgi:hypothetical protein
MTTTTTTTKSLWVQLSPPSTPPSTPPPAKRRRDEEPPRAGAAKHKLDLSEVPPTPCRIDPPEIDMSFFDALYDAPGPLVNVRAAILGPVRKALLAELGRLRGIVARGNGAPRNFDDSKYANLYVQTLDLVRAAFPDGQDTHELDAAMDKLTSDLWDAFRRMHNMRAASVGAALAGAPAQIKRLDELCQMDELEALRAIVRGD